MHHKHFIVGYRLLHHPYNRARGRQLEKESDGTAVNSIGIPLFVIVATIAAAGRRDCCFLLSVLSVRFGSLRFALDLRFVLFRSSSSCCFP